MTYILDTDLYSLLQRDNEDARILRRNLERLLTTEVVITVVTCEERLHGWLDFIARTKTVPQQVAAYDYLQTLLTGFTQFAILRFDDNSATEFERLRKQLPRLGTMDLKIAAIALTNDATLLSRNMRDFARVPDLRVEDWTI